MANLPRIVGLTAVLFAMPALGAEPVSIDLRMTLYDESGAVRFTLRNIVSYAQDGSHTNVMTEDIDVVKSLEPWYEFYNAKENTFNLVDPDTKLFWRKSDPGPFIKSRYQGKFSPNKFTPGPDILGYKTVVLKQSDNSRLYLAPDLNMEVLCEEVTFENGKPSLRKEAQRVYRTTLPAKYFTVPADALLVSDPDQILEKHEPKRDREVPPA